MRIFRTAASIVAVAGAIAAPASAQTQVMRGGNTVTQMRGGGWNGQMRGGGQVRQWNGQTGGQVRQWNGQTGGQNRQWNGQTRQWTGGQVNQRQSRWGGRIDGRWHGGMQAPGGWSAYRRPSRGWSLPSYWFAPSFFISDYSTYGLGAPPSGYNWTRYYDDAVLVDGRGRVYDSVGGLDWNRYDGGYAYDDSYDDGDRYYADGANDDYGPRGRDDGDYDRRDDDRRDNGVGGAVIGGVLGGVAGNVIAGRGDKLGGTLIGAGAGAIAGALIDRAEDRGRERRYDHRDDRRGPPPPYADRGAPYGYPDRGPPPPGFAGPPPVIQHGGGYETRVFTSGGYAGYGYYGGTTTTVTILPTTTTTTETITVYDNVRTRTRTWRAPAKHKVVRRAPSKILRRDCSC